MSDIDRRQRDEPAAAVWLRSMRSTDDGPVAVVDDDPLLAVLLGAGYDLTGLWADHRDDGSGRCPTCGSATSGRPRWPCTIALAAERTLRAKADLAELGTPERGRR